MVKKLLRTGLFLLLLLLVVFYLVRRPSWVNPVEMDLKTAVDPVMLQQHVKYLSTETNRSFDDLSGMQAASDYIKRQFSSMGLEAVEQSYPVKDQAHHNLIVKFGPDSGEVIVVGAHYDAYGDMPGADDNASGVAGLIELGRLLHENPPKQAIELVAYTLEEPPFFAGQYMGSFVHANNIKQPVKLMISLEMIGYFTDEPDSQHYPISLLNSIYPNQGNFIAVVDQLLSTEGQRLKNTLNRYTQVPAYSINAPDMVPGVDFSDHRNYWGKDMPAVMVTDSAFYRNERYHTEADTYDTLDYEKMAQVVLGVFMHLTE